MGECGIVQEDIGFDLVIDESVFRVWISKRCKHIS